MSKTLSAIKAKPDGSLTVPTAGDVDTWGDVLNDDTFQEVANALGWLADAAVYDVVIGFAGQPEASALDWLLMGRAGTIDSSDPGEAHARTNPTDGDWTFTLQKNGSSVGTVTIATDGSVSWSVSSDVSLAAGDRIEVVAPGTQDSAGADVQFTLRVALD